MNEYFSLCFRLNYVSQLDIYINKYYNDTFTFLQLSKNYLWSNNENCKVVPDTTLYVLQLAHIYSCTLWSWTGIERPICEKPFKYYIIIYLGYIFMEVIMFF